MPVRQRELVAARDDAEERVLKAAAAWAEDRLGKGEDHYITVSNELTLAVRARAVLLKKWGQR